MAATPEGAARTEQHRQEQQRIRAEFLVEFLAVWGLLRTEDLDRTSPGWVRAVMALIRLYRQESATAATRYYLEFRAIEGPGAGVAAPVTPRVPPLALPAGVRRPPPLPPVRRQAPSPHPAGAPAPVHRRDGRLTRRDARPAPEVSIDLPERSSGRVVLHIDDSAFDPGPQRRTRIEIPDIDWTPADRAAKVTLEVTGPVSQKSKIGRGSTAEQANKTSLVEASGAASRHVLTGGRQSLLTLLQDDPHALGWARVTDGDPCAFCAMLASRGQVYKTKASAGFSAHDHCACTAEPVYYRNAPTPGRGPEFRQLWDDNIKGRFSGKDALRAWRRLYEQQQRDQQSGVA